MRHTLKAPALWLAGCLLVWPVLGQPRRPSPAAARRPPGAVGPRAGRALDHLSRMPPEQRRRLLEQLPPERRKRVEDQLERYNSLPPEERERLREQLERFRDLPPEQQEAARQVFRRFTTLPEDRRQVLQEEFRRLREMEPSERRARTNSEEFRSRFSSVEQQILRDYVELLPAPR